MTTAKDNSYYCSISGYPDIRIPLASSHEDIRPPVKILVKTQQARQVVSADRDWMSTKNFVRKWSGILNLKGKIKEGSRSHWHGWQVSMLEKQVFESF